MSDKKAKKVGIAVIGCGHRSEMVVSDLLLTSDRNVRILAAFAPDKTQFDAACKRWKDQTPIYCDTYQKAIEVPGVEWVMLFSPNAHHREHIEAAFKRALFETWPDPHAVKEDAFTCDKDLLDTQVCCADYRNGIKVNFMATMANAYPERRM